ncbi:MAG: thioesterase [Herpetosiphonaceae bacterium]|nr:thioesterase [Herpetosiphonaceae bacterium]
MTIGTMTQWLAIPRPNPRARLRLFCFPYAGGTAVTYRAWMNDLPADIEICAIQLPGRESRLREAPFERMTDLITTLGEVLKPSMSVPFAFFGHSMGALVAFELARYLRRHQQAAPLHLMVSARPAPHLAGGENNHPAVPLYQLPDAELTKALVNRYNAIPQAILNEPELLSLLLPTIRADFTLLETYEFANEPPLECPISAFGGLGDTLVSEHDIAAWREHTDSNFKLRMFEGDHFYLRPAQTALLQAVCQDLMRTIIHVY